MRLLVNDKGAMIVEIVLVLAMAAVLASFLFAPYFSGVNKEEIKEFHQFHSMSYDVTIIEKNLLNEVTKGVKGSTHDRTKKYILFEMNGEEYFVNPIDESFFNKVKQDGKMKVYIKNGSKKLLGEAPDGTQTFLMRY